MPATMDAWVIREDRFGEPRDAFRIEQIEVPEPGAMEVIVRVMAAGVNYNNVWAAMGEPISVFRYHPEDHHIGGSDASGIVERVGPGVTRWKPGDEVVIHCNQASYEDPEVHGLDPMAAPSQKIWGYETTWGSFAEFCKVQAQQLIPKPPALSWDEAASYGLTYFTAYRMLMTQTKLQAGQRVLVWGAAGGLGVFALQLCKLAGAEAVGVVSSPEKGELCMRLGACDYIDRNEFTGMLRRGGETPEEEKARFKESRRFCKLVEEKLGAAPDIVFEHVGRATFPTSVLVVQPVRQRRDLRRNDRLQPRFRRPLPVDEAEEDRWLALRERVRMHEGERADRVRSRPSRTLEDARLRPSRRSAPAHERQPAPRQDRDPRGRGSGGTRQDRGRPGRDPGGGGSLMAGVVHIPWYATLFRGDQFQAALEEIAPLALRYGGTDYEILRSNDDRYRFFQLSYFEAKLDWERYWYGPEFNDWRADYSSWYQVPVMYTWCDRVLSGQLAPNDVGERGQLISPARAGPS